MTTTRDAWAAVEAATLRLAEDPDSDVVWAGEYEGRLGVRMAQQVRDFTTVWFEVGERTVGYEAYVLPELDGDTSEVWRQCLVRNAAMWRAHFALDRHGAVVLRGRFPVERASFAEVDAVLGAIYEAVELSFKALLAAWRSRREKRL